jgi:hypothetical protein
MKANTSSQDRKRAASVNRAGTPSSLIRREVGSSSGDGQPRHVEIVRAGGVAAGDLGLFIVRHPGQDLHQDLPRWGNVDPLCGQSEPRITLLLPVLLSAALLPNSLRTAIHERHNGTARNRIRATCTNARGCI